MTFAWLAAGALPLGGVACGVEIARVSLPAWVAVPLLAVVLKPTFAWRMLHTEVAAVERAAAGGVAAARAQLARLVSRDVNALDGDTVRETSAATSGSNAARSSRSARVMFASTAFRLIPSRAAICVWRSPCRRLRMKTSRQRGGSAPTAASIARCNSASASAMSASERSF